MEIEFDLEKQAQNIAKHGLPLGIAKALFESPVYEYADNRRDYGEARWVVIGTIRERVLVCVYTWRGATRRIISLRKANKREQEKYHKKTRQD